MGGFSSMSRESAADNIYRDSRFLGRSAKQARLQQAGAVFWLYGLSGSGKSTIAVIAERLLDITGIYTIVLDGDNMRKGLNAGLGFSDEDRRENIRRLAEVARLLAENGVVVLVSAITPKRELRTQARNIVGTDFHEVFVAASFETCSARDPKGLYKKVNAGEVKQFTGKDSSFEEPDGEAEVVLDTEAMTAEDCALELATVIKSIAEYTQ